MPISHLLKVIRSTFLIDGMHGISVVFSSGNVFINVPFGDPSVVCAELSGSNLEPK
jgi:hypothetical protein